MKKRGHLNQNGEDHHWGERLQENTPREQATEM
jgi:hypothetical protein